MTLCFVGLLATIMISNSHYVEACVFVYTGLLWLLFCSLSAYHPLSLSLFLFAASVFIV